MQEIYIHHSFAMSMTTSADDQRHKDENLRDKLMRNIQKARTLNPPGTRKPLEITPDLKIDNAEFSRFYLQDENWDSIKSYLVGAAIFWGLADFPALETNSANDVSSTFDLKTLKGKLHWRNEVCIF
jgi:hypothetical protein